MSQTFVYLPKDFFELPSSEVGNYAAEFSKLGRYGVPIVKIAVVPINTLKIIAEANNLQAKIYKIVQETNYSSSQSKEASCQKIEHLISKQVIPKALADELLNIYHNYFQKSFILVSNSQEVPFQDVAVPHIHGDTNFVDAILEVWAKLACQKLKRLQLSTTSVHDIVFPSPILLKEQLEPTVSGVAYSYDTTDGNKNRVTILSTWGIVHPEQNAFDSYLIDVRTNTIIKKKKQPKQTQFRRVLGKLRIDEVLEKYKHADTIHEQDLVKIAQILATIKKRHLTQVKIVWGVQNNHLFVESVAEIEKIATKQHFQTQKKRSFFQIYSTLGNSVPRSRNTETSDGLVVYNSGKLLSVSATHPNEVVKTKQKEPLVEAITRILVKNIEKNQRPLIYRANNFTSKEFNQLQFATLYEMPENNPYLGFRGGLRYLSQQQAFQIELEALVRTLKKTQQPVSLLLPFVRSSEELTKLISVIRKYGLLKFDRFSIWLELSTPENALNLSEYPLKELKGIVFNTQSMHALLTGVDPTNQDISVHYQKNLPLLKQLVENSIQSVKSATKTISIDAQPKFFVDLTSYDKEFLEQLCDLEITGFIVNEQVTELVKKCIMDIQHNTVL